jgi:hypothetical protein
MGHPLDAGRVKQCVVSQSAGRGAIPSVTLAAVPDAVASHKTLAMGLQTPSRPFRIPRPVSFFVPEKRGCVSVARMGLAECGTFVASFSRIPLRFIRATLA